jgi:hypothetical protein
VLSAKPLGLLAERIESLVSREQAHWVWEQQEAAKESGQGA